MKSEIGKTVLFLAVALAMVAAANWIEPFASPPAILSDEGQPLFPAFRDVSEVKAIEVIAYDESEAVAEPLKVEFRNNRWLMPSHHDYPAGAAGRLDKTAGALLGLKKDIVVSDRVEDQAEYGVIDPLDEKVASLTGRGKHVTLRNGAGDVLADVILGRPMPDHKGYRYLRLPGSRRIYGVKTDADPSARFEDWVEPNLLRLSTARVRRVTLDNYSIDEALGRVLSSERVVLNRTGSKWSSEGSRKFSRAKARGVVAALASIRIAGARPKPKPLAEQLRAGKLRMTLASVMSLRQRGFFLTQDGRLLANDGELTVETDRGLVYKLRFGEIVTGGAGNAAATGAAAAKKEGAEAQPRYLFVTVNYSEPVRRRYGGSSGERTAKFLNGRFADWYYVISGDDFRKIRGK